MNNFLLPEGFRDTLPNLAAKEVSILSIFFDLMLKTGYQIVRPSIIEFEKSLFFLNSDRENTNSFRILDPLSQKMMGLRSDMTTQIARIASSTLKKKRPLRLSYFGDILKVKNSQLNISRQSTQLGAEFIGIKENYHEFEIIELVIMFLSKLQINDYSISFSMPSLFNAICKDFNLNLSEKEALKNCYENKNISEIKKISKKLNELSKILIKSIGLFSKNIKILEKSSFPKNTKKQINDYIKSLKFIKSKLRDIEINIDPIEIDKFGYHNGILFKFYSKNFGELISGGKYNISNENCIGFSCLLENLSKESFIYEKKVKKIFIPSTEKNVNRTELIRQNFFIVDGFIKTLENKMKNHKIKNECDYILLNNKVMKNN